MCMAGFFAATDKKSCTACTANCGSCTSSATCNSCNKGYYGDGTATCTAVSIANCATYSKTAAECTECNDKFFLATDKKSCTACTANCDFCTSAATCTLCATKYWGDGTDKCTA